MLRTLNDINPEGKRVLIRCDFNVPLKEGEIADDTRIKKALPTINELLEKGASVILMSHLGRPGGEKKAEFSLRPVSERLGELLEKDVKFCQQNAGPEASRMAQDLKRGEILLLENLRFNPGEKENDPVFAGELASLADCLVQDAFGTIHREHASMTGVPEHIPAYAGRLLEKEIKYLTRGLKPEEPLCVCLGGAKIETKIGVIENMLGKAASLLIGGGMCYTLLKADGRETGKSLLDNGYLQTAGNILAKAKDKDVELLLPVDHVAADSIDNPVKVIKTGGADVPEDLMGVDISERTIDNFRKKILSAKTIVLNGPMGVFENERFASGTKAVLEAVVEATKKGALSIAGGGDTVSAIKALGFKEEDFTHVSTGGGASLKFLEGKTLPGIRVLQD